MSNQVTAEPVLSKDLYPNKDRRHDRLGIHSIGEFLLTVPSLEDARRFYAAFGLDVRDENRGLTISTNRSTHIWGRIRKGDAKKFERLTFHCFADEMDSMRSHIKSEGIELLQPPAGETSEGLWIASPDGLSIHLRAGPKTTPDLPDHKSPPLPVTGTRCMPYRRLANVLKPTRLSHIALMTPNMSAQIDFFTRVLGLRLSDRSGDMIAFLHGPHGSDHHLLAFATNSGPALHHLSWDVPTVEDVGLGRMAMAAAGFTEGWGVGRHVLGSNYFYYARDPWGSFCEFSSTIDHIPASLDWVAQDHPPEDGFFLWGPDVPPFLFENSEAIA